MTLSKTLVTVGAGALAMSVASFASAIDGTITSQSSNLQHMHINLSGQAQGSAAAEGDVRYNAVPGPYAALPAGDGQRGFNFYQASGTGSSMYLGQFQFVGGTNTAGGSVTFNFYSYSGSGPEFGPLANSFSVALPQAGNFIWTITIDPGFEIPTLGRVEMVNGTGGLGTWFLTSTAPAVGTSFGSPFAAYPSQAFALIEGVPAPGALALLGMAGLARSRRRR
jgi:MYXO-CTERM domain-containing protein